MLKNLKNIFKNPVTTVIEKSEVEDLKKSAIKLVILSAIMSLISVVSQIVSIIKRYSKDSFWYSSYSSSELWDKRWEAIKDAELVGKFFKSWVIIAIVILVLALILFIIAKIIKSPKEYILTLSMVNNCLMIYVMGYIAYLILSFIYVPLALIVLYATVAFSSLTLINAYRDTLQVENTNLLVIATTGVTTVLIVVLMVVLASILKVSIKDITSVMSLLNF